MSRRKQTYYQYDPFRHETKQVDLKDIAYLYDLTISNIRKYIHEGRIIRQFNVMIYNHKPSIREKRQANEKVTPEDELWRHYKPLDIYVSNYGRMKMWHQNKYQFKLLNDDGVDVYVQVKNHKYRAFNVIYETFFGKVKAGCIAYPKSRIRNDFYFTNVDVMTKWSYQHHFKPKAKTRTVLVYDKQGCLVDQFDGVRDASLAYYVSEQAMSHRCLKELTIDALTFKYQTS